MSTRPAKATQADLMLKTPTEVFSLCSICINECAECSRTYQISGARITGGCEPLGIESYKGPPPPFFWFLQGRVSLFLGDLPACFLGGWDLNVWVTNTCLQKVLLTTEPSLQHQYLRITRVVFHFLVFFFFFETMSCS